MIDENRKHLLRARATLVGFLVVGLAVLAFAIWAYVGSTAPRRGSAGPLSEEPPVAQK